jgi:hypothetical protein
LVDMWSLTAVRTGKQNWLAFAFFDLKY